MWKTKTYALSLFIAAAFVASGALVLGDILGTQLLQAQLTGQGAQLTVETDTDWVLHAAAPVQASPVTLGQFVLGLGLILFGFALHGLVLMRRDRPVYVRVVKRRTPWKAKKMFVWFAVRV